MNFTRFVYLIPLMMSWYPALQLANNNDVAEVPFRETVIVMVASTLGVAIVLLVARMLLKDTARAVVAGVVLVIVFFSYGHVAQAMNTASIGGFLLGRQWYLIPVFGLVTVVALYGITRAKRDFLPVMKAMGVATVLLVGFNLIPVVDDWIALGNSDVPPLAGVKPAGEEAPDIYWFLFDGYGREDVLREIYDYDNSPFLNEIRSLGFEVADASSSNYVRTKLSVTSTMGMNYLGVDTPGQGGTGGEWVGRTVKYPLDETTLGATASAMGYSLNSFASGDAGFWSFGDFTSTLMDSTMLRVITTGPLRSALARTGVGILSLGPPNEGRYLRENLTKTVEMTLLPEPTFTFSYVYQPHNPYVFKRDGSTRDDAAAVLDQAWASGRMDFVGEMFVDQTVFLNGVILETIKDILDRSEREPIIVLSSDHGPGFELDPSDMFEVAPANDAMVFQKMSTLGAILVPESCRSALYPTITPVNVFRVIFDACLGSNVGRLPDEAFWGFGPTYWPVTAP